MFKTPFPTTREGVRRHTRIVNLILDGLKAAEQEGLLEHFEFGPGLQTEVSQYDDALDVIQGQLDAGFNASDEVEFIRRIEYDLEAGVRDSDRAIEVQLVEELVEAGLTGFYVQPENTVRDEGGRIHIRVKFDKPISVARLQRAYEEFDMPGACKLVGETILMDSEVGDGT